MSWPPPPRSATPPAFTPPPVQRLEVTGGGWRPGQGQVTVTFLAVPMSR